MFVDEAEIYVCGGKGGHGCMSFRRERYIPHGGPDGGDGGDGGDVIIRATPSVETLLDFAGRHHWIAQNGQPGQGKDMTGKSGSDLEINLPPGTLIHDRDSGMLIKDLTPAGASVVIAKGGKGGRGNTRFATATHQTPDEFEPGTPGEERWLRLELKLIADVGLVGLPNAGKSTLLSRLSNARPKIAGYPFTTLKPQLGIVELSGYRRYVMADLPGLIEGAHEGIGLGDAFLRHIERTRVVLHLVDVQPGEGDPTPAEAYRIIRNELEAYSKVLADKPEIVAATKTDLADDGSAVEAFQQAIGREVLPVSAVTGKGLSPLSERLWQHVKEFREAPVERSQLPPSPHSRNEDAAPADTSAVDSL